MSSRTIVILLSTPDENGEVFADALSQQVSQNNDFQDNLVALCDEIAQAININPLQPSPVNHIVQTGPDTRNFRLAARKKFLTLPPSAFPIILWHPTSPLLIPFWKETFAGTDFSVRFVLIKSNILQVCDTLAEAHNISPDRSIMLWTQTMVHALKFARKDLIIAHYTHLLSRPEKTLSTLLDTLSLKAEKNPPQEFQPITDSLHPHMEALAYTKGDIEHASFIPAFVRDLNATLDDISTGELAGAYKEALNPILDSYEEYSFFLATIKNATILNQELLQAAEETTALVSTLEAKNRALEEKLDAITNQYESAGATQSELTDQINALKAEVKQARTSNNEEIGTLSAEKQSLLSRLDANETTITQLQSLLEQQRKVSDKKIATLTLSTTQLTEQKKTAETLLQENRKERTQERHRLNLERASLIKQYKAREQELLATLKDLKSITQAPSTEQMPLMEETDETLAASDANILALEEQLAAIERTNRDLSDRARQAEQALLDQDATVSQLRLDADAAKDEVRALKSSTSWKISAPIRGAKTIIRNPVTGLKSGIKGTARLARKALPGGRPSGTRQTVSAANRLRKGDLTDDDDDHAGGSNNQPEKPEFSIPPAPDLNRDGLDGYVPLTTAPPPAKTAARAIAFYLPQYHPIPENDQWWGEGFTEWTNVRPAAPQFEGHYQPHIPDELGYYDLLENPDIVRQQTDLAKLYGLSGFAFYFYWFAGKRLLEAPLQNYLNTPSTDFPYCLCWANENWNRRWDGAENEILIAQNHTPEDDINFISYLSQYLRDPRYIRINGKPLIVVYRPGLLPNAYDTADRWRDWCLKNGIGDIYLAYTQGFEKVAPSVFGFDAAIEFPPNNHGLRGSSNMLTRAHPSFAGKVFDWRDLVKRSFDYPMADYKLFRGVNPSWDNTARRGHHGTILLNSNPADYYTWLNNAVRDTQRRFENPDERLVFINAWNEWAEGAHLEPDQKYGYAWLEASRRALSLSDSRQPDPPTLDTPQLLLAEKKILIVTHDLYRHGAQFLSLNFVRTLTEKFGFTVHTIAGKDGPLRAQFENLGSLTVLQQDMPPEIIATTLKELQAHSFTNAFVNSAAAGWLAPYFAQAKIRFIGLVHEMKSIIETMGLEQNLQALNDHASDVIFPAKIVRDQGIAYLRDNQWANATILPQGVYKQDGLIDLSEKEQAKQNIEKTHAIPKDAKLILGVGFADHRKGIDLFLNWAIETCRQHPGTYCIWIGDIAQDMQTSVDDILASAKDVRNKIYLPGFISATRDYYLAADVYVLSSREDPFPSTALEALNAATPVIMMAGTGGIEDLSKYACVKTIPDHHTGSFLTAVTPWLNDSDALQAAGQAGLNLMRSQFGFTSYVGNLLKRLDLIPPAVSAIIPNYNYETYLTKRLTSVTEQSLPPREVIFLDDASTDNSVSLATSLLAKSGINHQILVNEQNSGNVFSQWQKGTENAQYPLTWIAEADDWAAPTFLETLSQRFNDEELVLAFSESRQVNSKGAVIAPNYHDYVRDMSADKWHHSFKGSGPQEIAEGFVVKNSIPNVSGALFRTNILQDLLKTDIDVARQFRAAGDWYIYVNILRHGDLWFEATALNYHRRHDESVTISKFDLEDLTEIADMQHYVIQEFSPPQEQVHKAKTYLEHLISHFSLHERYSDTELQKAMHKLVHVS